MTGQELTKHLISGYVFFAFGGVLSAVPKGIRPEQVELCPLLGNRKLWLPGLSLSDAFDEVGDRLL